MNNEMQDATARWEEYYDPSSTVSDRRAQAEQMADFDKKLTMVAERLAALEMSYPSSPMFGGSIAVTAPLMLPQNNSNYQRLNHPEPPVPKDFRDLLRDWCYCGHPKTQHADGRETFWKSGLYKGLCCVCTCSKYKQEKF